MTTYFVPYSNNLPAAIDIKGHKLILVSTEHDDMQADLEFIGGDTVREINLKDDLQEQTEELAKLAESVNGGVVLTPPGVSVSSLIRSLENELPWLH